MNFQIFKPVEKQGRINELDIFRGFAILGIFMVNILVMQMSFAYRMEWEAEQSSLLNRGTLFFLESVFYSKFFTIFSFLFGLGVALQIQRFIDKNQYSTLFFLRRFGALFIFGFLHILFIWSGDILHLYAILGLLLLLLFKLPAKTLLWLAALVFFFPLYNMIFEKIMKLFEFDHTYALSQLSREELIELKRNGSYYSGLLLRIKEFKFAMGLLYAGIGPMALSMMLLGGYLVKKKYHLNFLELAKKVSKALLISLAILLAYRFTLLYGIIPGEEIEHGSLLSIVLVTFYQLSDIATALFFLWALSFLSHSKFTKNILHNFSYVGRTAFSNYILQSVIGYLTMRTFSRYETLSPFECSLFVLIVFIFQIFISKLWLQHFKYGPLEWLWRCISYWKFLKIR